MMLVKISLYYCIFNKDPGWRPATLLMRDSGIGVFCEFCEFFKNTYFGTVVFLRIRYLRVYFREVSCFHYEDKSFRYISLKIPEHLNSCFWEFL